MAGPPGGFLAVADADTVGLVDLAHNRMHVIARGDASANVVNGMMVASHDEVLIATTGQTKGHGDLFPGITEVNVITGKKLTVSLAKPPALAAVNFLRVSPDERTWFITGSEIRASNSNAVAATWAVDARSHRVLWTADGPRGAIASPVQASPDSKLVAVAYSSGAADVIDAATGQLIVREASSSGIGAGDLAIPKSDNSLVTVSLDGVFRTWATRGSEELHVQAPPDPAIDFTPDGRDLVLVGSRGELVDRRSGQVVRTFPGFPAANVFNTCNSACFSASPQLGWLTYLDPASATPQIDELDGRTGERVASVTVRRLDAQGVAPDGTIAAAYVSAGQLHAELIDPRTGATRVLAAGQSSAGCAATAPSFSRDGTLMAIGDGCINVDVWDVKTGRVTRTFVLADRSSGSGARLTPDGRYVLAAVLGGAFIRADLATDQIVERPGAQTEGNVLGISPNGNFYAIGRQDGTVDVYDARTLRLVRHHTLSDAIETLVFSPDSQSLAMQDARHGVWVWDTCAYCENPVELAKLAAKQTVRTLTPGERATFNVK